MNYASTSRCYAFWAALTCGLASTPCAFADPNQLWEWPDWGVSGGSELVQCLLSCDNQGAASLVVGGGFTLANLKPVNYVALWDGKTWSGLGGGTNGAINAVVSAPGNACSSLYVAGMFSTAGNVQASRIAHWNGEAWLALGSGIVGIPRALAIFDEGQGPMLFAGGQFQLAGGITAKSIARWNGLAWSEVGGGTDGDVLALTVFDGPSGSALVAAGSFLHAGGKDAWAIAGWNGSEWSAFGGGFSYGTAPGAMVRTLDVLDDPSGAKLFAAGFFTAAGGVSANGIAVWDGQKWAGAGNPPTIYDFATFKSATGEVLYASSSSWIGKWNGKDWEKFESSPGGEAVALAVFDDGSGARLHAGGLLCIPGNCPNIVRSTSTIGGAEPCGDLTGDGFVDQQDLGVLLGDFGCTKGLGLCPGDCDSDGDTDQADLGILLANWEKPCP